MPPQTNNKPQRQGSDKQQTQNQEVFNPKDFLMEIDRHFEEIEELLTAEKSPLAGGIKLRFLRHIKQDRQWIQVQTLGGGTFNAGIGEDTINPLLNQDGSKKNIMGYEVGSNRKAVVKADLFPKKNEKAQFADNVKNLYLGFIGMTDADIINQTSTPGFDTLIRGVAKVAGVKDWETCEIDVELFADIREGIREKAKDEAASLDLETEFEEFK